MTDKETSGIKEEPKWVGDYNKANPDISHNRMKEILSTSKTVTKEEIERILSTTKYFTIDQLIAKALSDYKQALKKEIEKRLKELLEDEGEFSDEEVLFATRECNKFLKLLDTVKPY